MTPRIELKGIAKQFGPSVAVAQLDLAIQEGEFIVLLGPSGCGKTTTLRMIAGLESPSEGQVCIDGKDVTELRPGNRDIAFVFQLFALYPHLTVQENVAFPLRAAGTQRDQAAKRVKQVMARLELEKIADKKPRQLSGGDQQRVSLARAMVRNPKAFLMDEPLGTLDADQRERTREQLRAIHNELQATTVFVTHDQLEAMSLADKIAIMNNGKLLQFDTPREIYDHPADLFVAHFIGMPGMNFLQTFGVNGTFEVEGTRLAVSMDTRTNVQVPDRPVLGIRPEFVGIEPENKNAAPAMVEHTEMLGAYNLVDLRLIGRGVQPCLIKARVPAGKRLRDKQPTRIYLDPAGCRWFDPASGKSLRVGTIEVSYSEE